MPAKRRVDYKEVYQFTKEWGKEEALEQFEISRSLLRQIISIGDAILDNKPISRLARPIDQYSPRELMQELARRGYEGKLSFKQTIDIQNF